MASRAQQAVSLLSADDFFEAAPPGRCELVRGEVVEMSPTGGLHGRLASRIDRALGQHVESQGVGEVFVGDTGFILSRNPDTVRAPDVAFVSKNHLGESKVPERFFPIAPDIAVQVVSPSDHWHDVEDKVMAYLEAGTQEVWIVDPRRQHVRIRTGSPAALSERVFGQEDVLTSECLPDFSLDIARLFA